MATTKLTIKEGQHQKDVVVSAGSAIAGSDAMELNIDITGMTKGQARLLLKELDAFIHQNKTLPFL
jgi:hypothetical protein